MSQENVELVRRAFQAGAANSADALLPFVPADVVWYAPPGWVEEREYRGHDGVRRAMAVWSDTFDDYRAELAELHEAGERVVVLVWQLGKVKGSDEEVRQKMGVIYADFRAGTIGEARFYFTWEEALEAAAG
jgi:ketosteroid isomerase-like protein